MSSSRIHRARRDVGPVPGADRPARQAPTRPSPAARRRRRRRPTRGPDRPSYAPGCDRSRATRVAPSGTRPVRPRARQVTSLPRRQRRARHLAAQPAGAAEDEDAGHDAVHPVPAGRWPICISESVAHPVPQPPQPPVGQAVRSSGLRDASECGSGAPPPHRRRRDRGRCASTMARRVVTPSSTASSTARSGRHHSARPDLEDRHGGDPRDRRAASRCRRPSSACPPRAAGPPAWPRTACRRAGRPGTPRRPASCGRPRTPRSRP